MPRILWKGEKKVVAQGIPKILFFKGCYEVSPDSDVLEVVPSKKMGGLPVALWQVHSVETGQAGWWHPRASCLRDALSTSLSQIPA